MVKLNFSSPSSTRLLEWSLSAFHTSLFFWLFAIVLYLTGSLGNLLASLNTIVGVIIFIFLWATTWFCTRLVVRQIVNTPDWGAHKILLLKALALATLAGGVNGLVFFLTFLFVAAIVVALMATGSTNLSELPALLIFALYILGIGSSLAFGIGAVFGLVFGLLDLLLLGGSQVLFALNSRPTKDERRTAEDEERMAEPQ